MVSSLGELDLLRTRRPEVQEQVDQVQHVDDAIAVDVSRSHGGPEARVAITTGSAMIALMVF